MPSAAGGSSAPTPGVRNEPFAAVAPSWAFCDELVLPPGESLTRRYRIVVADGVWERAEIAGYLAAHPW